MTLNHTRGITVRLRAVTDDIWTDRIWTVKIGLGLVITIQILTGNQ